MLISCNDEKDYMKLFIQLKSDQKLVRMLQRAQNDNMLLVYDGIAFMSPTHPIAEIFKDL